MRIAWLVLVLALVTGGPALAQRHGGGHGGGGPPGGGRPAGVSPAAGNHGGGYHPGGYYPGTGNWAGYPGRYYYGGDRHHDNFGDYAALVGLGLFLGNPLLYGGGYYGPGPYYGPYVDPLPPTAYAPPALVAPPPGPRPVMLNVLVPTADAQVLLGDSLTASSGTNRLLQSPPLDPSKEYQYTVTVRWIQDGKNVEQKRDVPVRAGQNVIVDFRPKQPETIGPPREK